MCASNSPDGVSELERHAEAALAAVEQLTAKGAAGEIGDETVQRLLLAGIRLYAHKVDTENRTFEPVPQEASVNATEVAVTVTELMRRVDLNMFDLAMWSGRMPPQHSA